MTKSLAMVVIHFARIWQILSEAVVFVALKLWPEQAAIPVPYRLS